MKKKIVILFLSVFICNILVHGQPDYKLTNEQESWLSKADRPAQPWTIFKAGETK